MRLSLSPAASPNMLALADGAAIVAFAMIGVVSHTGGATPGALLEDALPLLAGWSAAAAVFRLYSRPTTHALLLTWAVGVPLGVAVRAAVLGRLDEPRQLAFLATTLLFTFVFVAAARIAVGVSAAVDRVGSIAATGPIAGQRDLLPTSGHPGWTRIRATPGSVLRRS